MGRLHDDPRSEIPIPEPAIVISYRLFEKMIMLLESNEIIKVKSASTGCDFPQGGKFKTDL
jgi:hypothetical protein